jgi:hypothetical protein
MPAFRSFVRAVFLFCVVAGLSLHARSQTANPATTTIRVTSDLVYLDVTVVDRNGNPVVTGLTKNDFTITEPVPRNRRVLHRLLGPRRYKFPTRRLRRRDPRRSWYSIL